MKTHGKTHTPIYRLWWGMISRCTHPKTRSYNNYGGKGVTVCPRWLSFDNFFADMGDRPDGMTLERVDNSKGYEPSNVIWASNTVQQRHRSDCVYVEWEGTRYIQKELCAMLEIAPTHIPRNMARGMSRLEAIRHLVALKEKRNAKVLPR